MSMWRKYGFACEYIVAYSIPFNIDIGSQALAITALVSLAWVPKKNKFFF